jgi:antirestriction protein ArdC
MKTAQKQDVYQIVTDRLIAALESGTAPWRKTWKDGGIPHNAATKRAYSGINLFLLACQGGGGFLTYKQAQSLGGCVRKGEKGTPVVYWNFLESKTQKDAKGNAKKIPFLKYFTVFRVDQCDGLELPGGEILPANDNAPIPAAQFLVEKTGANIHHGGFRAFYRPSDDSITLPPLNTFESADAYYATAFHELAHWSGHESRLKRDGITEAAAFGSATYSKEELVAEMAASYLCAETGIEPDLDNSAAYLQSWIKALKGDSKLAVRAAGAASKAADFILGRDRQAAA